MRVILLGPQRRPTVDAVARSLGLTGPGNPVATITAGWQEREPDDQELSTLLGGRAVNLSLYRRWLDVQDRDPGYAAGERELAGTLAELQDLYLLRLDHALQAVYAVQRRTGEPRGPASSAGVISSGPMPSPRPSPRCARSTRRTCAMSTACAASPSSDCGRTTGR